MAERGNALSRNPNICASCSSLLDGMGDSNPAEELSSTVLPQNQEPVTNTPKSPKALKNPAECRVRILGESAATSR
jgi:hypothetical protein